MTNRQVKTGNRIIRYVETDMKAEGFSVSKQAKRDCHAMIRGEVSADQLVGRYVSRYVKRRTS